MPEPKGANDSDLRRRIIYATAPALLWSAMTGGIARYFDRGLNEFAIAEENA